MTDPEGESDIDEDALATRLAAIGVEASGWLNEFDQLEEMGVDVDTVERAICGAMVDVQKKAAQATDRKLYDVIFHYKNVLAKGKDDATREAENGFGQLATRQARLVYDPDATAGSGPESGARPRSSELERGSPSEPDPANWGDFLRLIDELCIDPVTGETVLPDFVLISEELYDQVINEDPGLLRPMKEPTCFEFAVRIAPHEELVEISGTDEHMLVFDRRKTLRETVQAWEGPDGDWEEAVRRTVDT